VPIGLLEYLPGKINDRPPAYRGRDELGRYFLIPPEESLQLIYLSPFVLTPRFVVPLIETLLASPDSRDWVKISEMVLGPAPDAWTFVPKHKSNAYESQG
jgi:tRNA-dihydrouridine synthase 3